MAVPDSFLAIQERLRGGRFVAPLQEIASRHEFCEDLACLLSENARAMLHDLGIAQEDVLRRCQQGLHDPATALSPLEADWVLQRLAEILLWPLPQDLLSGKRDPIAPTP